MGLTVSYHHAWRRNLSSGLGLPFPRMMARRPCHIERGFDFSGMAHANSVELADHLLFVFSPFSPRYQQMLISCQNRTGKRFIHLPYLPYIMPLGGNCNSCTNLLFDISLHDIMSLAGNCISYAGPFSDISPLFAAAIARSSEEDERSRYSHELTVIKP